MQNLFGFIIHPLELGIIWLSIAVNSAGIGIILFTIIVRLVLAPLLITQLRSSRAMQRLQPMVADLKKKHGNDRQALSQATMALYKEQGVNPAMGCLPTLLQFPILIGLFYAFMSLGTSPPLTLNTHPVTCSGHSGIHTMHAWLQYCYSIHGASGSLEHIYGLFHAKFLWLSNGLGQHDPLYILPVLAGVTQWIQSRMMLTRSDDPQQQMMNSMMNFMPLLIVFFALRYASGLSLYWVTSTIIAIAIQARITGWGLLPRPSTVLASFTGGGPNRPRPRQRAKQRTGSNKAPRQTKLVSPVSDTMQSADADSAPPSNGQDGSGGGARRVTAGTGPRKKANRAKGGRGGRR